MCLIPARHESKYHTPRRIFRLHKKYNTKYHILLNSLEISKMCILSNIGQEKQSNFENIDSNNDTHPSNYARLLKVLYCVMTALCGMMVFWILFVPSSWLVGHSSAHERFLNKYVLRHDGVSPPETITKYAGHLAIQLSHILPGALWAGSIPFQLHPGFRREYKEYHKVVGYIFFTTALIMTAGMALILKRGLVFTNDFSELPPLALYLDIEYTMVALALWFSSTIIIAIQKAKAKDFVSHRVFIIRHVSSGLWVAVQRVILVCHDPFTPLTRVEQRILFHKAAECAMAISFIVGEMAIFLIRNERETKQVKKAL